MTVTLTAGFGALAAAAVVLQRDSTAWRLAAIGAVAYGLGAAAVLPEAAIAGVVPGTFGAVNAGLLTLGAVSALLAAILGVVRAPGVGARVAALVAAALAVAALIPGYPFVVVNGAPRVLLFAGGLALGVAAFLWALRAARVGEAFRWLDRRWLLPAPRPATGRSAPWWIALVAVSLLAAALPLALLVLAWCVVVVLAFHRIRAARGAPVGPPVGAIVLALALAWALRWLVPIAGLGAGVRFSALFDAPVSPAAAILLIPALLLAGWLAAGLWPFHGLGPGPVAAVAAIPIVVGLGAGVCADGVTHVAPLLGVAAVLAAAHAAATGDPARLLGALGMLALVGGTPAADQAATALFAAATLGALWQWELRPARWGAVAWSLAGAVGGAAAFAAAAVTLRVEAASTAAAALAAVALLRPRW